MTTKAKRYIEARKKIDRARRYTMKEAVALLKETATVKFDETVELVIRLGSDPRKSDQNVRSTVILPHGTGKTIRVAVITKGETAAQAKKAGAVEVGDTDLIKKIQDGWLEFDVLIATPDMMRDVGKLGKMLGRRGLMPNPKAGTVTKEIEKAVLDAQKGKIEFRNDKGANVHVILGKISFDEDKILQNMEAVFSAIARNRPTTLKGVFMVNATLSTSMGPGIRLDMSEIRSQFK